MTFCDDIDDMTYRTDTNRITLHYGISYGFIYKLLSGTEDNEEFRSSCDRVFFTCQLGNTNGEKERHGEKNKRLGKEGREINGGQSKRTKKYR